MKDGLYYVRDNVAYEMVQVDEQGDGYCLGDAFCVRDAAEVNGLLERFAGGIIDKVQLTYCRGNLPQAYWGMQICDWVRDFAEKLKFH